MASVRNEHLSQDVEKYTALFNTIIQEEKLLKKTFNLGNVQRKECLNYRQKHSHESHSTSGPTELHSPGT
jgi:hypothetical protein